MQELALLLSSIAGACTAAAYKKFPKNKTEIPKFGFNPKIKSQIHSLLIEKDILTKTITRLYQNESGLTKIQRDKLLLRYQHQLGIILAKIEKLEAASKHPDLGPLGDGLITLMDQKLSQLDSRLLELSSKITLTQLEVSEPETMKKEKVREQDLKPKEVRESDVKKTIQKPLLEKIESKFKENTKQEIIRPIELPPTRIHRPVEITTLTEITKKSPHFPHIEGSNQKLNEISEITPPQKLDEKVEILQQTIRSTNSPITPKIESQVKIPAQISQKALPNPLANKPKPTVVLPEDDNLDEDDDDLEKIKGEIMKTLSKLDQAEVE